MDINPRFDGKKIIIFDLDGVLMDSIGFLRNYIKNKYEGSTENDFKEIFYINFWDGLQKFKEKAQEKYLIHEDHSPYNRATNDNIFIFEGVKDLLEILSKKYILVVNSSDSEKFIMERLAYNGILPFFDCIVGKETSVNKIEKFNLILEKYTLLNNEAVFISDTVGDILEADKANIDSIAVTWGVHTRNDFEKFKFNKLNFISDNIEDLYRVL